MDDLEFEVTWHALVMNDVASLPIEIDGVVHTLKLGGALEIVDNPP